MKYISTRGGSQNTQEPQTFTQVLLSGLAPDGGLYVPTEFPTLDLDALRGKSYQDIAEAVMFPFVEGDITRADLRAMIDETYGAQNFRHKDVVPLHHVQDNLYALELFHGPTIAFKDVALQMLGRLFNHVLKDKGERVTIVGATSGDTGSAAIEGCKACDLIDIFILHPNGRVSDVQRKQMTTIDAPNVFNIALEGTFDDCQDRVKDMFNDHDVQTSPPVAPMMRARSRSSKPSTPKLATPSIHTPPSAIVARLLSPQMSQTAPLFRLLVLTLQNSLTP